jgi:aminoglycoside phosphotransferase (APT) family kinase protein
MKQQGVRLPWDQVPAVVRDEVAAALGSAVVRADNQPGGFSPGVAARCGLADGRRCFIKAVSPDQNDRTPDMHRREAVVTAALPPGLPVPALRHVLDDGHWVVLVFDEIDGHPPAAPWSLHDLRATFAALDELSAATTPCPIPELRTVGDAHEAIFSGFRRLAAGDAAADRLDRWTRRHLDRLAELEAGWTDASAGDALLHSDLRADNLLVRPDGSIVVVDWPSACAGAPWVDKILMLPSVADDGGPMPVEVEQALDPFAGADPDAVDRVVTAFAGYLTYHALLPAPPGLPTVRAFQDTQGRVARTWLAARLGLTG